MDNFQVVRDVGGIVSYPPGLPGERSYFTSNICYAGVILFFISMTGLLVHNRVSTSYKDIYIYPVVAVATCITVLGMLLIISKTFLLVEEISYLHTRHGGDMFQLFKRAYLPNIESGVLFVGSVMLTTCYGWDYTVQYGVTPLVPALASAIFLLQWVKMDWSSLKLWSELNDMNGLDYGSGMAYSFFYGYLNIVLPKTGDLNKGINERINDYVSREGLSDEQFPVKKLLILIPSSAYIPTTLNDHASEGQMLNAKNLEEQRFDVAGVQSRSYKNTVYKIRRDLETDSKPEFTYVVAEGATPLKTLHQVVNSGGKSGYGEYQSAIIHLFYKTLRQLIRDDPRVHNLCELIYYVDKDETGSYVNIAHVILQRVKELEMEKRN